MPKTPDNVFGRRLAAYRMDFLGMTSQEQLAAAVEMSVGTVRGWEQGISVPQGEAAWKLFHLFGPDVFADLMPHIRRGDVLSLPVGDDLKSTATIVALRGSRTERLAHLVRLADRIAREESYD